MLSVRHLTRRRCCYVQTALTNLMDCYGFFTSTGGVVFVQLQSYSLETGYDYVYFLDGGLTTSPVLGTINGAGTATATYCGSGNFIGVHLKTDSTVIAGGISVAVWLDGWYCSGNRGYACNCASGYYCPAGSSTAAGTTVRRRRRVT